MKILLAASTAAAAGLIATGALGVAGAETTTTSPAPTTLLPRTVSVEGVAKEPIEQNASASAATTVYRQGMADAIADGLAKAQFLAGKTGAAVGTVQSISEGDGYIGCTGETEYLGSQPDFGSPGFSGPIVGVNGAAARPGIAPGAVHRPASKPPKKKKKKRPKAKKAATVGSCTLSTQVALSYQLN